MRYRFLIFFIILSGISQAQAQLACRQLFLDSTSTSGIQALANWKEEESTLIVGSREISFEATNEKEINLSLANNKLNSYQILQDLFAKFSDPNKIVVRDAEDSDLYPPKVLNFENTKHKVGVYKEVAHHYKIEALGTNEEINVRYKKTYASDTGFLQNFDVFSKKLLTMKVKYRSDGIFENRQKVDFQIKGVVPDKENFEDILKEYFKHLGYDSVDQLSLQYLGTVVTRRLSVDLYYQNKKIGFLALDAFSSSEARAKPADLIYQIEVEIFPEFQNKESAKHIRKMVLDIMQNYNAVVTSESKIDRVLQKAN